MYCIVSRNIGKGWRYRLLPKGGKPLVDSRIEIARAIDGLKLCIDCMRSESGSMPVVNSSAATRHHLAFTTSEPIGVVVAVVRLTIPLILLSIRLDLLWPQVVR